MSGTTSSYELGDGGSIPRVSERFCATDSDLPLQSSDGVLYKVHRRNLELHSEGFAAAAAISAASDCSEIVQLSESSAVLDLLLQYIYRQRQPDLDDIDFGTLAELAEAVEKYEIYSAMKVCSMHMRDAITLHAAEVLHYAFKHDYIQVMDAAAPLTIGLSLKHLATCWAPSPEIWLVWVQYHQAWLDILSFAHRCDIPRTQHCKNQCTWDMLRTNVACNLGATPGVLRDLQQVFGSAQRVLQVRCSACYNEMTSWRKQVEAHVIDLPKFSTLRQTIGSSYATSPRYQW